MVRLIKEFVCDSTRNQRVESKKIVQEMAVRSPSQTMEYIKVTLDFFLSHKSDVFLSDTSRIYTKYIFVKDPDSTGSTSKGIEVDCVRGTYSRHDVNSHADVNVTPRQLAVALDTWYTSV